MEIDKDVLEIMNKEPVNEMAKIVDVDNPIAIYVYSDDHNPPHFHLGVVGGADIRIAIPETHFETVQQVKNLVLKPDKSKISKYAKYFSTIISLLKAKPRSKRGNLATNLDYIQLLWDTYHSTDIFTDVNAIL